MVGLALALEVLPLVPLLIGVLMLLYGISGAYQPSVQASLPLLVPEEGLVQANALVNMVSTLAGLLGPVVGGVLFGAFGVYPIVLVLSLIHISGFPFLRVRELIFSIRSIIIEKIPTEEKRGWQEMKDVITVATMRESDAHTIALYVPSRELMYRAAMGVYQAVNWQGKKAVSYTHLDVYKRQSLLCHRDALFRRIF